MLDLTNVSKVSSEPFEFGPIQTKWLEALESGNYKQGQGVLRSSTDEYCCLGVLCELLNLPFTSYEEAESARAEGLSKSVGFSSGGEISNGYLPFDVAGIAGLRAQQGDFKVPPALPRGDDTPVFHSLAHCNDMPSNPLSFAEIAQLIRHDPHNVFAVAA